MLNLAKTIRHATLGNILALFTLMSVTLAPSCRAEDMAPADWYRQAALTGLLKTDYEQTMEAYDKRWTYTERNGIINQHYNPVGIRNYFLVVGVGHAVVTRALPANWRPAWQYGAIALEVAIIVRNKRAGLHFTF